jgi:Protein of unknown function (DUF4019)
MSALAAVFAIVCLGLGATPVFAADPAAASRVVNITRGSTPGWLPSEALETQARRTATDFLAALDAGRFSDAYALLAESNRKEPIKAFAERLRKFNRLAGPVRERRIAKLTWTHGSGQTPRLGTYVAVDLVSRFAQVERHCGFVVLHQPPAGGDFQVARVEDNYIDDASAQGLGAGLDAAWARMSAHCPGYAAAAKADEPLQEAPDSTIGYPTVAAALQDLRSRPEVAMGTADGWVTANEAAANTYWSFPPAGHPAYPAAVKRQVVQQHDGTELQMTVLCRASKTACDNLVRSFEELNAATIADLRRAR